MNIEVGKFYRTRGGHKARIYALDGEGPCRTHGAILAKGEWVLVEWTSSGSYGLSGESINDLVEEWADKPCPKRKGCPIWANWKTRGRSGRWFWHQASPQIINSVWVSSGLSGEIPSEYTPQWIGDWRDSLVRIED